MELQKQNKVKYWFG